MMWRATACLIRRSKDYDTKNGERRTQDGEGPFAPPLALRRPTLSSSFSGYCQAEDVGRDAERVVDRCTACVEQGLQDCLDDLFPRGAGDQSGFDMGTQLRQCIAERDATGDDHQLARHKIKT